MPTKVHLVKAIVFPVDMYGCELDHKESWAQKNWCFWTVVLEKTLESPLDCRHIKLVNPKGNQSWIFIKRTDIETEAPILWRTDAKNWLIGKIEGWSRRDDREWDGRMAPPAQWTWVWASSRSWWWTGKPYMLQFMESRRVRHNWATELNWTELRLIVCPCVLVAQSYPTQFLCLLNFRGKNTGASCHSLLQRLFLTQGSNLYLLHWQADFLPSDPPGKVSEAD